MTVIAVAEGTVTVPLSIWAEYVELPELLGTVPEGLHFVGSFQLPVALVVHVKAVAGAAITTLGPVVVTGAASTVARVTVCVVRGWSPFKPAG